MTPVQPAGGAYAFFPRSFLFPVPGLDFLFRPGAARSGAGQPDPRARRPAERDDSEGGKRPERSRLAAAAARSRPSLRLAVARESIVRRLHRERRPARAGV